MSALFGDLQNSLMRLNGRKTVLAHLAELLDGEFLAPNKEAGPKHFLLMDNKLPVPQEVIDEIAGDLLKEVKQIDEEIQAIMATPVAMKETKS